MNRLDSLQQQFREMEEFLDQIIQEVDAIRFKKIQFSQTGLVNKNLHKKMDLIRQEPAVTILYDPKLIDAELSVSPQDQLLFRKVNRILAIVPSSKISNPIAALINYFLHQLRTEINWEYGEDNGWFHVKISISEIELVKVSHIHKKVAKEVAAREVLLILNHNSDLVKHFVKLFLEREKASSQ